LNQHLTTQPDSGQPLGCEEISLGDRHFGRLAGKDFDSTCRTASITATGMQLIHSRIFKKCQYQSLSGGNFKISKPFDSQFRHDRTSVKKESIKQ
jgi:hypothetical protein